jgi:hypothetical protein
MHDAAINAFLAPTDQYGLTWVKSTNAPHPKNNISLFT